MPLDGGSAWPDAWAESVATAHPRFIAPRHDVCICRAAMFATFASLASVRLRQLVRVRFRQLVRVRFRQLASVRLRQLASTARWLLSQDARVVAPVAARVTGLQLQPQQPVRALASFAIFTSGLLWLWVPERASTGSAVACFVGALTLRFGFLFASFVPAGVAARLQARFGMERGHEAYAAVLDLLLFVQRVSFVALVCATANTPDGFMGAVLAAVGLALVALGVTVSLWAAHVVGLGAYHYRDLFTGSRSARLETGGPYALWRNPMYTLGPLAGYGLALMALSPIALLAAGLNQALLFAFNELIEQPRLRSANSIFEEAQYRYDLARSLLGFDPRPELARRVHSAEPALADARDPAM
jgi:protein-S-isoprenylcysteine O-methyltransferase Ste14